MALREIHTKYSRFISNAYKNSRVGVPRNPIQESFSKSAFSWKPSTISQPISMKSAFKNRGWFHNPKRVGTVIFLFGCGAAIGVASGDWVTVPYSERNHFILFHKFLGKISDLIWFDEEPLPLVHPDSIMARRIFQDIIDQALPLEMEIKRQLETQNKNIRITIGGFDVYKKVEKLSEDDKCEIIVVSSDENAAATFGRFGKIYITKGMIDHYRKQESMIATILGHEVGKDLARHPEEMLSKFIGVVSVIGMSVYLFWQSTYVRSKMPSLVKLMQRPFLPSFVVSVLLFSYLPMAKYWRETDMEADYIGLMLAASARYNPVVGLRFPLYKIKITPPMLPECFYPLPTIEGRCLHLSHPEVLLKAVSTYRRARAQGGLSPEVEST